MNKWWGIIIVISAILSLILAGLLFIYFRNKQILNNKVVLTAPKELSTNFDSTVNSPKFSISSVNPEDKTLLLKIVYPYISKDITSKITCSEGDIKMMTKSNQTPEDISFDTLFEKVQVTSKEYMIFSGICKNQACTEIYKECNLYIGL